MRKKSNFLMTMGLLLIAAALLLTGYNIWDGRRADQAARSTVESLWQIIPNYVADHPDAAEELMAKGAIRNPDQQGTDSLRPEEMPNSLETDPEKPVRPVEDEEAYLPDSSDTGLDDLTASEEKSMTIATETADPSVSSESERKEPSRRPETEDTGVIDPTTETSADHSSEDTPKVPDMPVQEVNGKRYIGVLDVETLNLSLPVMEEWSYTNLKVSPCRFAGNLYADDLVICAHNYPHHFSPLKHVALGTEIVFTDMEGTTFRFVVSSVETVGPNNVEQMTKGEDWDLTLFTCNPGGGTRCAIRCVRAK